MGVVDAGDPRRLHALRRHLRRRDGNGVYVPPGWTGKMPNGDTIKPGVSLPGHPLLVQERPGLAEGRDVPGRRRGADVHFHRFWAQTAIAAALGDYARLFEGTTPPPRHDGALASRRV